MEVQERRTKRGSVLHATARLPFALTFFRGERVGEGGPTIAFDPKSMGYGVGQACGVEVWGRPDLSLGEFICVTNLAHFAREVSFYASATVSDTPRDHRVADDPALNSLNPMTIAGLLS